jgi:hypothetical protein
MTKDKTNWVCSNNERWFLLQNNRIKGSADSYSEARSVIIMTRLQDGRLRLDLRQGKTSLFPTTSSRLAVRPTQLPIQWALGFSPWG